MFAKTDNQAASGANTLFSNFAIPCSLIANSLALFVFLKQFRLFLGNLYLISIIIETGGCHASAQIQMSAISKSRPASGLILPVFMSKSA